MQMLKSFACLQCNITEGEQTHRHFTTLDYEVPPQGARVCNHDSFKQQLHQSALTAEFKSNLSCFPLCTAFPSHKRSELSKESIVEKTVISIANFAAILATQALTQLLWESWIVAAF